MTKTKKIVKNYVDNDKFYDDIVEYKKKCRGLPEGAIKPKIPDYSGKCIYLIAENIALMKNNRGEPAFAGYSFLEEMKGDAIENCIQYFDNFDEVRFKKPFAYFSRIIYFAFLRRIDFEKQQLYYKYKTALNYGIFNSISTPGSDSETASFEMYNNLVEYVDKFETKKQNKKIKESKKKKKECE